MFFIYVLNVGLYISYGLPNVSNTILNVPNGFPYLLDVVLDALYFLLIPHLGWVLIVREQCQPDFNPHHGEYS